MYWAFFAKLMEIGVRVKAVVSLCSDVQCHRKLRPLDGVVLEKVVRVRVGCWTKRLRRVRGSGL